MSANKLAKSLSAIALIAIVSNVAMAAEKSGCVELKSEAQTEQAYTDERGQKATRFVPAGKVVPGDQIIWTITARNVCDKPTDNVVVANPVPEHMTYVAESASGVGAEIGYSLEGHDFKKAAELTVRDVSGATRAARPAEYRYIRWVFKAPFDKGAVAFVRYRATVD
jgi:uncharacterized repeat protein (TIGR01451 family)